MWCPQFIIIETFREKGLLWELQYLEGLVGQDLSPSWVQFQLPNRDRIRAGLQVVKWAEGTRLRQTPRGGMI